MLSLPKCLNHSFRALVLGGFAFCLVAVFIQLSNIRIEVIFILVADVQAKFLSLDNVVCCCYLEPNVV